MRNVRIVLGTELSCFYPAVGVFIVEKEMQVFLLQIAKLHHGELGRCWLGGRAALFASLRTHRDPRLPEIDCAFHDLWLTATCVFRLCVLAFVWPLLSSCKHLGASALWVLWLPLLLSRTTCSKSSAFSVIFCLCYSSVTYQF